MSKSEGGSAACGLCHEIARSAPMVYRRMYTGNGRRFQSDNLGQLDKSPRLEDDAWSVVRRHQLAKPDE